MEEKQIPEIEIEQKYAHQNGLIEVLSRQYHVETVAKFRAIPFEILKGGGMETFVDPLPIPHALFFR